MPYRTFFMNSILNVYRIIFFGKTINYWFWRHSNTFPFSFLISGAILHNLCGCCLDSIFFFKFSFFSSPFDWTRLPANSPSFRICESRAIITFSLTKNCHPSFCLWKTKKVVVTFHFSTEKNSSLFTKKKNHRLFLYGWGRGERRQRYCKLTKNYFIYGQNSNKNMRNYNFCKILYRHLENKAEKFRFKEVACVKMWKQFYKIRGNNLAKCRLSDG